MSTSLIKFGLVLLDPGTVSAVLPITNDDYEIIHGFRLIIKGVMMEITDPRSCEAVHNYFYSDAPTDDIALNDREQRIGAIA